ncbi:hypothetical protein SDC9_147714 [bioreactor metagenome]|uniref:Uncharacterized protein n=1 Tax=bioreactor metagenome TaxID=1076179 RepID=A0A645EH88_9ZZZZ
MAQAFFDEEQIEVGAPVKQAFGQATQGLRRNVLEAYIGRIADDGIELLMLRVGKEVHHRSLRRTVIRVQFQPHRTRQMAQEGPIATGRLQHPSRVATQCQHGAHHRIGRKHLTKRSNVTQIEAKLQAHRTRPRTWRRAGKTRGIIDSIQRD